jgi:non-specific protein-tyrosine kinase
VNRQWTILRRWAWLLVVSVALAGGAAFMVSRTIPPTYEAQAKLGVGQFLNLQNPDPNQITIARELVQFYVDRADRSVYQAAADSLGPPASAESLLTAVDVVAATDSAKILITAQDGDPTRAAQIANAVARALVAVAPPDTKTQVDVLIEEQIAAINDQIAKAQAELQRLEALPSPKPVQRTRIDNLTQQLNGLRSNLTTLLVSSKPPTNSVAIDQPAVPPTAPSSPRILLNTALAGLIGLLIAAAIAFVVEHLDDTLKTASDVAAVVGASTLGLIPKMKGNRRRSEIYRLVTLVYPRSSAAESFRTLRANIEFASVDRPMKTLVVTSPSPGEGKTTTAANLAVAFAQAGKRTVLLDADLRKPGVHRIFNLTNRRGLTSLLTAPDLSPGSISQETDQEGLQIITSGPLPPNPAELLGSDRFHAILQQLGEEFDIVVLDSPPVSAVADGAILASIADATIVVVQAGRTKSGQAGLGREALTKAGARVLGSVINQVPKRSVENFYYYYGSYGETDVVAMPQPPVQQRGVQ